MITHLSLPSAKEDDGRTLLGKGVVQSCRRKIKGKRGAIQGAEGVRVGMSAGNQAEHLIEPGDFRGESREEETVGT